ncbi:MAG TPA: CvpA family protein, partial [Candidatus Limnocylindrales bacterium]
MNISDTLRQINMFDIVLIIYLFGFFILGFIQGTIRRLIGIATITFSFFLALQLNDIWLGNFLATNWTQYPKEYSIMIGYLVIFVAASVAFALVVQGTYTRLPLFAKYPVLDEILGGVLGIVQGFLLLLFVTFILDQYFLYTSIPPDDSEFEILRTFWTAVDGSTIG